MSGDRYYIKDQEAVYFVTLTIVGWLDVFTRPEYKNEIVKSLIYCQQEKGLNLHAWCLMTSHLHLIISVKNGFTVSDFLRDFKKHTAKSILKLVEEIPESRKNWLLWYFEREGKKDKRITKYKFWKEDNHAIELNRSSIEMINQKIDYIHYNPVVEKIVNEPEHYLYSSALDYSGKIGLVDIEFL